MSIDHLKLGMQKVVLLVDNAIMKVFWILPLNAEVDRLCFMKAWEALSWSPGHQV